MTEDTNTGKAQEQSDPVTPEKVAAAISDTNEAMINQASYHAKLETRVTELENMVHQLASHALSTSDHPGVVQWMAKIGARIKAAAERVLP